MLKEDFCQCLTINLDTDPVPSVLRVPQTRELCPWCHRGGRSLLSLFPQKSLAALVQFSLLSL